MKTNTLSLLTCAALLIGFFAPTAPAYSQAEFPEVDENGEEVFSNAAAQRLQDILSEKMATYTQTEMQHMMIIYSNLNVLSMVDNVRADVKDAVTACGENNPEMKSEIDKRFEVWDEDVGGAVAQGRENVQGLIAAQGYMTAAEFESITKLIEEARHTDRNDFEKIPVTTPEACEFMLSKMDETQNTMKYMLMMTTANYAEVLQKLQQ